MSSFQASMCPVSAIMSSTPRTENKSEKEKILHCISLNFKCSLKVGQYDTVLQLSKRLGNMLNRPPSELALICKGKVLSRYPMSNLEALGIFSSSTASKLLISQRPPGPNWVRLTIVFLCSSSLSPVVFYMHADSLICRVQCQIREHLRCAVAQFALHLADGAALPEDETLRNLGVADDDRIYCRVLSEEPRPVPPSAMAAAAAAVRVLVLRADAAHFAGAGRKRSRQDGEQQPAGDGSSDLPAALCGSQRNDLGAVGGAPAHLDRRIAPDGGIRTRLPTGPENAAAREDDGGCGGKIPPGDQPA